MPAIGESTCNRHAIPIWNLTTRLDDQAKRLFGGQKPPVRRQNNSSRRGKLVAGPASDVNGYVVELVSFDTVGEVARGSPTTVDHRLAAQSKCRFTFGVGRGEPVSDRRGVRDRLRSNFVEVCEYLGLLSAGWTLSRGDHEIVSSL